MAYCEVRSLDWPTKNKRFCKYRLCTAHWKLMWYEHLEWASSRIRANHLRFSSRTVLMISKYQRFSWERTITLLIHNQYGRISTRSVETLHFKQQCDGFSAVYHLRSILRSWIRCPERSNETQMTFVGYFLPKWQGGGPESTSTSCSRIWSCCPNASLFDHYRSLETRVDKNQVDFNHSITSRGYWKHKAVLWIATKWSEFNRILQSLISQQNWSVLGWWMGERLSNWGINVIKRESAR